jgi:hypothetical protein
MTAARAPGRLPARLTSHISAATPGGPGQPDRAERSGVPGMTLRSEVEVLSWGPDRGNPTSMRQGRGSELTGRLAGARACWRASVRAGLEEAVDALWSRTRVKRRKASFEGRAGRRQRCPVPVVSEGVLATRSRRNLSVLPREICWVPRFGRPENERTKADGPAEVGGPRTTGRRGNAR